MLWLGWLVVVKPKPMTSWHWCMEIGESVINLSLFHWGQCIPSGSADMALVAFACVLSCIALMHSLLSLSRSMCTSCVGMLKGGSISASLLALKAQIWESRGTRPALFSHYLCQGYKPTRRMLLNQKGAVWVIILQIKHSMLFFFLPHSVMSQRALVTGKWQLPSRLPWFSSVYRTCVNAQCCLRLHSRFQQLDVSSWLNIEPPGDLIKLCETSPHSKGV